MTVDLNVCANCRQRIKVMSFLGLGYCSDDCRKALAAKLAEVPVKPRRKRR